MNIAPIIAFIIISAGVITPVLGSSTSCSQVNSLTSTQIWNLFAFSSYDTYFMFTIGSISVLFLALSLLTWFPYPSFALPADIVFIIIVTQLLDNLSSLSQVIYYSINKGDAIPDSFQRVCSGLGFFNMLGNVVAIYYNAFFCVSLAYSINYTLRKPFLDRFKSHILCLLAVITAIFIVIFMANPLQPLTGICIYKIANETSLGLFLLHLLIFIICVYSLKKFKAKVPKNTYFQQQSHFGYYYIYMIIIAGIEAFHTLLYFIGNICCQNKVDNLTEILKNIQTISNTINVLQAFATVALRFCHPIFLRKVKRFFGLQSKPIGDEQQKEEDLSWIDSLVESIKGSQILSFLQAIMINYIEHSNKFPSQLTPYHFQRQYSFVLDQNIAEDYVRRKVTNRDSHFVRQTAAGLRTLTYEVVIHTPQYYSWLFRRQKMNLFKSFDVRKNLSVVKKDSYTQGGKSGQYFFGTYDNQFIFKTIQSQQAEVYLTKTQQFYQYFCSNPDSLLIKILGLYKFTRKDIEDDSVYIMLMRNLTLTQKRHNIRVYDIKGSQFNRSTLSQQKIKVDDQEKLRKFTLKDKDFLQVEKKIEIGEGKAKDLKKILTRDIQFLGQIGVMDYSLLIIKRQGPPTRQPGEFESAKQPGIYFNFGIIDYLQEWTLRRKAERVFKTLITSQQVTADSPLNYSARLISFINEIL